MIETKKYTYDLESGGLLLSNEPLMFSLEPRPVYKEELDLLGFKEYFEYEDSNKPYCWRSLLKYTDAYSGIEHIAKLSTNPDDYTQEPFIITNLKNSLFNKHKLKPINIDLMIEKNKDIIKSMTVEAQEKIYKVYEEYKDKIDLFYVAFSGGKDSLVILDLVAKTLKPNQFKVVFGDTQMENELTYKYIETYIKPYCQSKNIDFLTTKSYLKPIQTWKLFGAPSNVLRWCCGVHKTAPQVNLLKTIKQDIKTLVFTGVRGSESIRRSKYQELEYEKKHTQSYSFHPILHWNSAQVYLYIYANQLQLNETYKYGINRCGCLVCPMSSLRTINDFLKYKVFNKEFETLTDIAESQYNSFKWWIRTSGKNIINNKRKISKPKKDGDKIIITVDKINNRWKEWSKTIGEVKEIEPNKYSIDNNIVIIKDNSFILDKKNKEFLKCFKSVIAKMSYCINCCYCASECPTGALEMTNTHFKINEEKCQHCKTCLLTNKYVYCLRYHSLKF